MTALSEIYHDLQTKTRALAERWVTALNETCSKSPTMEECEQELVQTEGMRVHSCPQSPPQTRKSQSATCLPILRLISKRSGRSCQKRRSQHLRQRRRRHSGSSTSTMDEETERDTGIACTSSLSPHTLLSSLGTPATSSGARSKTVLALTLPLRILCRRAMRHSNLRTSVSHHSRLSVDAALSFGNDGDNDGGGGVCDIVAINDDESSLASPYENGNDNSETDIDEVDEFS